MFDRIRWRGRRRWHLLTSACAAKTVEIYGWAVLIEGAASMISPHFVAKVLAIAPLAGANVAGTVRAGSRLRKWEKSGQTLPKPPDGRHVAWALNTLLEAKSLQESLIDFSDEFKR
jgi:hypothetical protein